MTIEPKLAVCNDSPTPVVAEHALLVARQVSRVTSDPSADPHGSGR